MGEKLVFSVQAHVFQIDQETKKRWMPSSSSAIRVAYYHDPIRKTYRIIAIENGKALINSTVTANMNFTKTSPKFGQWSDHRASTVYGLGFSAEKDLVQFVERFSDAKEAARKAVEERKRKTEESEVPVPSATSNASSTIAERGRREEAVVMNGESKKTARSSESSPTRVKEDMLSDDALRYENNKLKSALASSAQNVKKWEGEMKTLKSNNAKLTGALKESNQHVSEWKEKLQQYKEENAQLKQQVAELEMERGGEVKREEYDAMKRDMEELKEVLTAVQLDLEARQSEVAQRETKLQDTNTQLVDAKNRILVLEEENGQLRVRESELEDQLQMAAVASSRKLEEASEGHKKLGLVLEEAIKLHQSLRANYKQ